MCKKNKNQLEKQFNSISNKTETPCIGICSTLFDKICRGCGRTAEEVSNWVIMSNIEKEHVWKRIREQGYLD